MARSLDSARHKLGRAEEHLDALGEAITEYLDSKPHNPTLDFHTDGSATAWVEVIRPFPERIALLAGDAAHNLRTVLDHVVYDVSGGKHKRSSFFPICTEKADYIGPRSDGKTPLREAGLPGVHKKTLALIDAVQPYHEGDDAAAHPLACLARLDNADKHRTLQLALALVEDPAGFRLSGSRSGLSDRDIEVRWLATGKSLTMGTKAKVAHLTFDPPAQGEVTVSFQPRLHVAFGERARVHDLLKARDLIRDEIVAPIEAQLR